LVSRALLAFQALERDGEVYSDEAELGSHMKGSVYQAVIDIRDMLAAYFKASAEAGEQLERERRLHGH